MVIPIVFGVDGDPVGGGLVASLARPGGNVTGLSAQYPDLGGKRLELLREFIPGFRRLAILANPDWSGASKDMREVVAAARVLGLDVVYTLEIRKADDIAPAFAGLKGGPQVLYICGDALVNATRFRIHTFAMAARLPTFWPNRIYLESGGLITYAVNTVDLFRRAGDYVDRILRGAKPADLPVEQPTKFELVINLTTAKALGLTIPEAFLLRADELIE